MSADWNWLQIDKFIYTVIMTEKDEKKLYETIKKKFKWTDGQTKSAVDPLLAVYKKKKL